MEKLQLIDVFEEDDFLIASHLDDGLQDFRISVLLENIDENEDLKIIKTMSSQEAKPEQRERKILVSESMEPGRASQVRKSLAWDSAFFTSEGVLDPEELCIINRGFEKSEAHLVAKVRKDQCKRRSVDIESTLTNQSIEGDLFEDVRASIQRSSIMSRVFKSGCKSGISEARKQKARTLKKLDDCSQNRVKHCPISRRQSIRTRGSERTKEVVARSQIVQHAARNGERSLLFHKPSKILRATNPVSVGKTKILLGADPVKMEKKTVSSGSRQGLALSKRSDFGTSCCSISSMISPKSSSLFSVTASNDSTASCSPSFKFSSNSREKIDSKKTRLSATGSTSKTSLRCSTGSQKGLRNHGLPNHYSYASPASSINGWPSQSSSTSGKHCLETSLCTNNSRRACLHNVATQKLHLQSHPRDHQESQQTKFLNQCIDEVKGTDDVSAEQRRNFIPSGLRMPSPRIGFFDEEKSPVLSVLNFGTRSVLSNTNGEDLNKPQPASLLAVKGGSESTGVIMARHAPQSQEQEENPPTLKKYPWKPSKVESHISQLCRENLSKSREVSDGGYDKRKIGLNYNSKEEIMKNEMIRDSKAEPLVHSEGNGRARRHHHLENILPALHKDEKENSSTLDDRVNGLCRNFEAIDVSRDTAIDLNGMKKKKGLCNPIFDSNFTKMETAVEVIPNPRTPLVDRNSVCTGADSFGFTTG